MTVWCEESKDSSDLMLANRGSCFDSSKEISFTGPWNSSMRTDIHSLWLTKGCFKSSVADGRKSGSLVKHFATKFFKFSLNSPSN